MPRTRRDPQPSSLANDSAASSISEPERGGFDDLCDEILVEIIQRVRTTYDHSIQRWIHLFNFSMCSRRLLRLTEPILYEELTQERHSPTTDLLRIFRKILARPELGRCVKRFNGSAHGNYTYELIPFVAELTEQDRMRLRAAVDEASASDHEADRWIQAVEIGQWAAIIALLLSMTPNLEALTFEDWSYENDDYTYLIDFLDGAKRLQNSGQESPLAMSKLRSVSVSYYDTEHGLGIDQLMPFLELRSVETFHAHMVMAEHDPTLQDRLLTLNAKDLCFTWSAISLYAMVDILGWFPHLERFYYEYSGGEADAICEPPLMLKALEHLKSCLKELTILAEVYMDSPDLAGYPIGSLADFQKLVSITSNVSIMIGEDRNGEANTNGDGEFAATQNLVDVVPPTLEFLCFIDCQRHVVRHIFELVSQKSFRTPALRKIDLGWEGIEYPDKESPRELILHPGFSKDEVEKLMADCEEADIKIIIKYLPPTNKYVTFREEAQVGEALPQMVRHCFTYPYEGYEDCCVQHGCDPETGNPRGT